MQLRKYCLDPEKISYREKRFERAFIDKVYEIRNPKLVSFTEIPCGCLDLVCTWTENGVRVITHGGSMTGGKSDLSGIPIVFGVRLKAGAVPTCVREEIKTVLRYRISLGEFVLLPERIKYLYKDLPMEEKANIILSVLNDIPFTDLGPLTMYLIRTLQDLKGCGQIGELIKKLEYSHRHVEVSFRNETGLSIKKYADILRLQNSLEYLQSNRLDEMYEDLKYYDQSHFIRDFKKFTTFTPGVFRGMIERDQLIIV